MGWVMVTCEVSSNNANDKLEKMTYEKTGFSKIYTLSFFLIKNN